jgi:hypothetical protein
MITFIKQQYAFVSCIHNFHSRGYGTKRDLSHHCRPWLRLEESPSLKHTGELHAIVLIEMVPVRADSTAGVIFFLLHSCLHCGHKFISSNDQIELHSEYLFFNLWGKDTAFAWTHAQANAIKMLLFHSFYRALMTVLMILQ